MKIMYADVNDTGRYRIDVDEIDGWFRIGWEYKLEPSDPHWFDDYEAGITVDKEFAPAILAALLEALGPMSDLEKQVYAWVAESAVPEEP